MTLLPSSMACYTVGCRITTKKLIGGTGRHSLARLNWKPAGWSVQKHRNSRWIWKLHMCLPPLSGKIPCMSTYTGWRISEVDYRKWLQRTTGQRVRVHFFVRFWPEPVAGFNLLLQLNKSRVQSRGVDESRNISCVAWKYHAVKYRMIFCGIYATFMRSFFVPFCSPGRKDFFMPWEPYIAEYP